MPKLFSTVAMAALAPPYEYAPSIFWVPPVESGTHRSRGIDSMVTFFDPGLKRTTIIDWVSTAPWNLVSLSDPSSRTVNAPGGLTGFGVVVRVEIDGDGVGEGSTTAWLVASRAS